MKHQGCMVNDCTKPHEARGYCRKHYKRWMKHGTTDLVNEFPEVCTLDHCKAEYYGQGYCSKHYQRWRKSGDPMIGRDHYNSPEESFQNRTEWDGDCLIWTGSLNHDGYGQITWMGRVRGAHRYAWFRSNGSIPEDMFIDHTCFRPDCVNVDHLRLSTNQENLSSRSYLGMKSSSGRRNVYPHGNGWRVVIGKDGKNLRFGTYETIDQAAEVAEQARSELFGEFAGRG